METYTEFQSRGLTLRGVTHLPDGGGEKFPAVIMLHGFCDDKDEINFVHTELARKLCDRGIAVIRFDFAGSGSSDGLFEDMTISSEIADCLAVLDTVAASDLIDKERIALHGSSLGACIASMVVGMRPDRIKALSMWCPAPDVVYNLKEKI